MSIQEVKKVILKVPEVTSKEIEERLGVNLVSINRAIRCLMKDCTENLKYRELTPEEKVEKYGKNINVKVRVFWFEK